MPMTTYYTDSSAAQIGLTTMFSLLATADIIGNAAVCLLIIKFQDMRVPLNYLILNLAVADIIVALFLVPWHVFIHSKNHPDGLTGTVLCKLLTGGTLIWIGLLVSVFTLVAISFERYCAVVRTDAYQRQFTVQKLKIFVATIWISAAIFNLPQLLTAYYSDRNNFCAEHWPRPWILKANSLAWVIITGVTPISLMTGLYWRAIYTLWSQNAGDGDNAQQGRAKIQKRITKMAATVSLVFTLCWIPALTSLCVLSFSNPSQKQGHILQVISTVLVISNCSANPFIYVLVSHRFRRHFMELVCCAGVSNTKVYPAPRGKRASSRLPPVQIQLVSLADC